MNVLYLIFAGSACRQTTNNAANQLSIKWKIADSIHCLQLVWKVLSSLSQVRERQAAEEFIGQERRTSFSLITVERERERKSEWGGRKKIYPKAPETKKNH